MNTVCKVLVNEHNRLIPIEFKDYILMLDRQSLVSVSD